MAFVKKKKQRPLTLAEQAWIDEKLNAYKKVYKQFKGEIVFKVENLSQDVLFTSRYNTEKELIEDAKGIVAKLNEMSNGKLNWVLVSAKLIDNKNKDIKEDNED